MDITDFTRWRFFFFLKHVRVLRSHSAIYCAVEQVTEVNSGKITPGVDGIVYLSSEARAQLVQEISELNLRKYKPKPIKRVYIPKWDGRLRPLGLPVIKDRAVQWIAKATLEPEWEARFEYNSYGFRPGRGAHDAIAAIQRNLNAYGEQFVLEGDIEACFDNISHEFLLTQVKTPAIRRLVQSWLIAGVVDKGKLCKTTKGTPQGGVISPLLANIVLHGMDQLLGAESPAGEYLEPPRRVGEWQGVCLVRYADDFVVIANDAATLECDVKPALARFLGERGLSMNWQKSRVVAAREGFDFLGFNIRCRWWGYRKAPLRRRVVTTPAKSRVERHLRRLRATVKGNKASRQDDLIKLLNPIIRGWAVYYRHCWSAHVFSSLDSHLHSMLWQWTLRRHQKRSRRWIRHRYFGVEGKRWSFRDYEPGGETMPVMTHQAVKRTAYTDVPIGTFSPYAGTEAIQWWTKRAMGG